LHKEEQLGFGFPLAEISMRLWAGFQAVKLAETGGLIPGYPAGFYWCMMIVKEVTMAFRSAVCSSIMSEHIG